MGNAADSRTETPCLGYSINKDPAAEGHGGRREIPPAPRAGISPGFCLDVVIAEALFTWRATPHSSVRVNSRLVSVQMPLQAGLAREPKVSSRLKLQAPLKKVRGALVINQEGKPHRPAP